MSDQHPILRAVGQMAKDYAGSPGIDGEEAPLRIVANGDRAMTGFASVFDGLIVLRQFHDQYVTGNKWKVAEFDTLINPEFVVSITDIEEWPGSDEE